jgi:hypothetical protein
MSRALLQARHEGSDEGGDALRRSANDDLSSVGGSQAFMAGIVMGNVNTVRFKGNEKWLQASVWKTCSPSSLFW